MTASDVEPLIGGLLGSGYAALSEGNWDESRRCFQAALEHGEVPEAFEGLGLTAYFSDDVPLVFATRERAYQLYRQRGDRRAAARVACALAGDGTCYRGEDAIANGWLQRAHRLLDGLEPAVEHGMLDDCRRVSSAPGPP